MNEDEELLDNSKTRNFYLARSYFNDDLTSQERKLVCKLAKENDAKFDWQQKNSINKRLKIIDKDLAKKKYPSNVEPAFCETLGSQGLKAVKKISIGSLIGVYSGVMCRDKGQSEGKIYNFGICKDYSIDAEDEGNHTRFINSSNRYSNVVAYVTFLKGSIAPQIVIVTTMPIERGDWILLDYGQAYFDALELKPIPITPKDS